MFIMWLQAMASSYVISNDVFHLDSYGHVSVIYNILSHDIPSCVCHIEVYAQMFCLFLFFQAEVSEGRLSYPCISVIIQVFVICSFTILHRPGTVIIHASHFRLRRLL